MFEYIQEHLFGTYQNNVIVLHGQRRTGKTSILYRLKKVMADTHLCVLVDMQGKAARGTLDFLYSLADDIVYALEDQGLTLELPARSEFADSPEFFFRSRFLRSVYEVLPPVTNPNADAHPHDGDQPHRKHILLMFDEFEELQKRVEDGKLEPEIFPFLRNLMQHEEPLDFVFAGTHKLEELGAEYWSILFNIASYKKITFLSHDDAQRLITRPCEGQPRIRSAGCRAHHQRDGRPSVFYAGGVPRTGVVSQRNRAHLSHRQRHRSGAGSHRGTRRGALQIHLGRSGSE